METQCTFPMILLKEKLGEKAFMRRSCLTLFSYDDHEFEQTLGLVEFRPAKLLENGTYYMGQWLIGT